MNVDVGRRIGSAARSINRRLGIIAWLSGEPHPPLGGFDLDGEKLVDWGWISVHLPPGPKRALEIGPGRSPVVPAMLALGYDVTAVDFDGALARWIAGFSLLEGDFLSLNFDRGFDVVVACSVVEHIGLPGRYGSTQVRDGDLKSMCKMWELLSDDGIVLLTIPVGRDALYLPFHRVYGRDRLPRLLSRFNVIESRFLTKEPWEPWQVADPDEAIDYRATIQRYALGQFLLKKATT
jgi:Caenorhabditis protein of unknown function, DUF268